MKLSIGLLPLASLATALVIPEDEVLAELSVERRPERKLNDNKEFPLISDELVDDAVNVPMSVLDKALEQAGDLEESTQDFFHGTADKAEHWWSKIAHRFDISVNEDDDDQPPSPPPRDSPPHHRPPPPPKHDKPKKPCHGKPPHHRKPHHPPHHNKPNETIWGLISKSKYTTKLAHAISKDEDLVKTLNGTAANYTLFAPTDKAVERLAKHFKEEPSKDFIRDVLTYHISPEFYPAGRVLATHTFPTLLKSDSLGKEPQTQRLSKQVGLKGLTLNFYSRVIAIDIFATNGVIHGVDHVIVPPPTAAELIELLPGEFSTLDLALTKTDLLKKFNSTGYDGGTLFAPSNFAFQKLGPKINSFLFSPKGLKYLKALLKYHTVPGLTLYSDAFYNGTAESSMTMKIPKGQFHVDMPTLLEDKVLAIDVGRLGPFITIKINGFANVVRQDGIVKNGVIQELAQVLIPPKKLANDEYQEYSGEELTVDELTERLEPYVEEEKKAAKWWSDL